MFSLAGRCVPDVLGKGMHGIATVGGISIGEGFPVRLMAVINVSPESFYANSVRDDHGSLRAAAQQAAAEGADIIDVGAMSTAPYLNTRIPVAEEMRRMTRALEVIGAAVTLPLSADTARAPVAAAALAAGARIINDVRGLRGDPAMADVAAQGDGLVLMASPDGETTGPPLPAVRRLLAESLRRAAGAGIASEQVVIDPGIGFFRAAGLPSATFDGRLLAELRGLADLGRPLLVGVSRKSFIGVASGRSDPAGRLAGSLGATAIAVYNGASVVRTHDVAATRDAVRVAEALRDASRQ